MSSGGYTPIAHYFIDYVMPRVSPAEWKIITTVLRKTVGWHDPTTGGRVKTAEIAYSEFESLTGLARQAVALAVKRVVRRTVVKRHTQQEGKQRTFRYEAIEHANLKPVPKPDPRRHQLTLGYDDSEYGNQTPSRSMENTPVTEYVNQTPKAPGLRSIKESRSIKHTHSDNPPPAPIENQKPAAAPRVCGGSKFTKSDLKRYARQVGWINSPVAWATTALRTGEWDDDVEEYLAAEKRLEERYAAAAIQHELEQNRQHARMLFEQEQRTAAEQRLDAMDDEQRGVVMKVIRERIKHEHPHHPDWLTNPEILRSMAILHLLREAAEQARKTA